MTDFVWPSDIVPFDVSFYLEPHTGGSESPFSRKSKLYGLSKPRWVCSMRFRAPDSNDRWGGTRGAWGERIDAFLADLDGRLNRVALFDFRRRGRAPSFSNALATAATNTMTLTGASTGSIRVGEYIGGDGRPHIITKLTAQPWTFDTTTTGWTALNAGLSAVGGRLRVTKTGSLAASAYRAEVTVIGQSYTVSADLFAGTTSQAQLRVGTTAGAGDIATDSTLGAGRTITFTAVGTTTYISLTVTVAATTSTYAEFDNVLSISGAGMVATVKPYWETDIAIGAATFQNVTGFFRLTSDDAGMNSSPVGALTEYQLDFVEDDFPTVDVTYTSDVVTYTP